MNGSLGYSKEALRKLETGSYRGRKQRYRTSDEQINAIPKKVPALEGMTRSPSFNVDTTAARKSYERRIGHVTPDVERRNLRNRGYESSYKKVDFSKVSGLEREMLDAALKSRNEKRKMDERLRSYHPDSPGAKLFNWANSLNMPKAEDELADRQRYIDTYGASKDDVLNAYEQFQEAQERMRREEHPILSGLKDFASAPSRSISTAAAELSHMAFPESDLDKMLNSENALKKVKEVQKQRDYVQNSSKLSDTQKAVAKAVSSGGDFLTDAAVAALTGGSHAVADVASRTGAIYEASPWVRPAVNAVLGYGQTAGETRHELERQGVDIEKARQMANASGLVSAAANAYMVSSDVANTAGQSFIKKILNAGAKAGAVGAGSQAANETAQKMIFDNQSQFDLDVKRYMSQGMSEKEAGQKAAVEILKRVGTSGGLGFIVGAGLSALTNGLPKLKSKAYDPYEDLNSVWYQDNALPQNDRPLLTGTADNTQTIGGTTYNQVPALPDNIYPIQMPGTNGVINLPGETAPIALPDLTAISAPKNRVVAASVRRNPSITKVISSTKQEIDSLTKQIEDKYTEYKNAPKTKKQVIWAQYEELKKAKADNQFALRNMERSNNGLAEISQQTADAIDTLKSDIWTAGRMFAGKSGRNLASATVKALDKFEKSGDNKDYWDFVNKLIALKDASTETYTNKKGQTSTYLTKFSKEDGADLLDRVMPPEMGKVSTTWDAIGEILKKAENPEVSNSRDWTDLLPENPFYEQDNYKTLRSNEKDVHDKITNLLTARKALDKARDKDAIAKINSMINDLNARLEKINSGKSKLKSDARTAQLASYQYADPVKASQNDYPGFDITRGTNGEDQEALNTGKAFIAEMSPLEYLQRTAYDIYDTATLETTIEGANGIYDVYDYANAMRNGERFPIPSLNYNGTKGQEGRTRALAAYVAGIDKIPVAVIGNPSANPRNSYTPIENTVPEIPEDELDAAVVDSIVESNAVSDQYTPEQRAVVEGYNNAEDTSIIKWIDNVRSGNKSMKYKPVAKESDVVANIVERELGLDIHDNSVGFNKSFVNHETNEHMGGRPYKSNISDKDLSKIAYVINNPDDIAITDRTSWVTRKADNTLAPVIAIRKRIDGQYYIIEAVTDAKTKQDQIITAFIENVGDETKEYKDLFNHAYHVANAFDDPSNPSPNVLDGHENNVMDISTTNVHQNGTDVNGTVQEPNNGYWLRLLGDEGFLNEQAAQNSISPLQLRNIAASNLGFNVPEVFNTGANVPPTNDFPHVDGTIPGKKVSQTYTNTGKNGGGWNEEEYEKYTNPNDYVYEDISEAESVEEATRMRREEGREPFKERVLGKDRLSSVELDGLMMEWRQTTQEARALEAQGLDASALWSESNRIFRKIREQSTNNAQALQALAKWSRNTPEGMLASAENIINGKTKVDKNPIQKALDKFVKVNKKFEFSEDFIKDFLAAAEDVSGLTGDQLDTPEAKQKMAELGRMVNEQLPVKLGEKVTAFLMDNMLGNFRTLITRNAGGNVGLNAFEQVLQRPLAAAIDSLVGLKTGVRTQAGLTREGLAEYIQGFAKGIKDEVSDLKTGLHTSRSGENTLERAISANRHVFKTKVFDKADSLVKNGLSVGDRPFYEAVYKQTLGDYHRLRPKMGEKVQNLSDSDFEEFAKTAAQLNALAAVYQKDTLLSDALLGFKKSVGDLSRGILGVDVLSQFSMPFVKTPANVVDVAIDYSPLGFIRNAFRTTKELHNDSFDQNRFANETARNTLGTALMGGAAAAAAGGAISGAYSDDKDEKQAQKDSGEQEYALNLPGNHQVDIGWMPVVGSNSVAAAATQDAFKQGEGGLGQKLAKGVYAGGKSLFDQSMFQGLQRLFGSSESYNSDEGIVGNMANVIKSGVGQGIPSLLRQIGQVIDPLQRDISNSNAGKSFAMWDNYDLNSLAKEVPWLREKVLAPKVDTSGELLKENQGRNVGMKILEDMILPGKVTKVEYNNLNEEAKRLKELTTSADAYMPKVNRKNVDTDEHTLTNKEWTDYEQRYYKEMTEVGNRIIQSDFYQNADNNAKVNTLKGAYDAIKSAINSEYNGKEINGAAKKYVEAGGGNAGVQAVVDYYENKAYKNKAAEATGLDANTKKAEEIAKDLKAGNTQAAQKKIAEGKQYAKTKKTADELGIKTESYDKIVKAAGSNQDKVLNSLPELKRSGISGTNAYLTYAKALSVDSGLTTKNFINTFNTLDADNSKGIKGDELLTYFNKNKMKEPEVMRMWNMYAPEGKSVPYVKKDGSWGKHVPK